MTRFPTLRMITVALMVTASYMASGTWCYLCHDTATKECREGVCQVPLPSETPVDLESLHHSPAVDFGGGDY